MAKRLRIFAIPAVDAARTECFGGVMSNDKQMSDEVPWSDQLTAYDREHFVTYARLLDAEREGADADEIARIVLGIDPSAEPDRAKRALASHLKRAHWMSKQGYKSLLR